jgi:tRNA dimethylallyltransferase
MFLSGAIQEVKRFVKIRVKKDKTANKAIGIKEIEDYLNKKKNLEEIKQIISIKTRQYAKRQSTWARGHMDDWHKIKPQDLDKFLKKI